MPEILTDYYSRPEVSNSALTHFRDMIFPSIYYETEQTFLGMGILLDAMISEPEKVNYFKLTCDGNQYTSEEFEQARQMKKAFEKDAICSGLLEVDHEFQKVMVKPSHQFNYDIPFSLPVRCKWDIWLTKLLFGADIKTTTATSQKQFEEAARFFDYDRQRFFYMEVAGCDRDMIIGISKENFRIFKIPIKRGDEFWKSGRDKCLELAFRYWLMFGNTI
jgi:hypothetical protein